MFIIDGQKYVGISEAAELRTKYEANQIETFLEEYIETFGWLSKQTIASWMDKGLPYIQDDFNKLQPRYVLVDDLLAYERKSPGYPLGKPRKKSIIKQVDNN